MRLTTCLVLVPRDQTVRLTTCLVDDVSGSISVDARRVFAYTGVMSGGKMGATEGDAVATSMSRSRSNVVRHALNTLMLLSVFIGAVQVVSYAALRIDWRLVPLSQTLYYGFLIAGIGFCFVNLVRLDVRNDIRNARMISRALVALIVLALMFDVLFVAETPLSSNFILQFVLVTGYQMHNDPNLDRHNPREGGFKGLIPLSFFNLFWIFVVCSIAGLSIETVVSFFRDGQWESRAGFVFGPLSPIYGVGCVLITAALNRLYARRAIVQFLVAGIAGASFEYFAGWFFEAAFGIVAWSYEGQPFNFHGHTSLLMAGVWGAIGVLWMRFALPTIMSLIDRIPLRARTPLTMAATIVVLADAVLTVVCLDCWYLRKLGNPAETPWQQFCAQYFDDEFMQSRFETMSMWPSLSDR